MKKYVPFIFPAIALVIVLFLGYRWYVAQTTKGQISANGEGVKIEDLSTEEASKMQGTGAKDLPSVELKGEGETTGQVRYELKNDRVNFSVNAELPALKDGEGMYQVWVRQMGQDSKSKAFTLKESKSGYMGSAAFQASLLPVEVVVSKEVNDDDTIETTVLTGTIQKQ